MSLFEELEQVGIKVVSNTKNQNITLTKSYSTLLDFILALKTLSLKIGGVLTVDYNKEHVYLAHVENLIRFEYATMSCVVFTNIKNTGYTDIFPRSVSDALLSHVGIDLFLLAILDGDRVYMKFDSQLSARQFNFQLKKLSFWVEDKVYSVQAVNDNLSLHFTFDFVSKELDLKKIFKGELLDFYT